MRRKSILVSAVAILVVLGLCESAWSGWSEPMPVSEVNTAFDDHYPFLSFDGGVLYFCRADTDTFYYTRIYQATRPDPYGPFTSVEEISSLNDWGDHVASPWVSKDNLRMYCFRTKTNYRPLTFTERASTSDPWLPGVDISELSALGYVSDPALTEDELTIFFVGYNIPGGSGINDIWTAHRPDRNSAFGNIRELAEINTTASDDSPFISSDGLTLYFSSNRSGSYQIFKATRGSLSETFGNLEHLSFFDTPGGHSWSPCPSYDGRAFYFCRALDGQPWDIYVSYPTEPRAIDIKPGSCPNPLNVKSLGVLPVAVLGSEDFDVRTIDAVSIRLAGVAPTRSSYEDVATPVSGANECECSTEGSDGFPDLTLKFETQEIVEAIGEVEHGDELVLQLTAVLSDETPIEGSDCVIIRGRHKPLNRADFNGDGTVDMTDFAAFAENWLQSSIVEY